MKQYQAMMDWRAAGAGVFLLWHYHGEVRVFFENMIEAALEDRRSLVWQDGIGVPQGNGLVIYDFLTVINNYNDIL